MAGNLTHRGNILTVGECLCKNDFVQNKFLKIIIETMRARGRTYVYVRVYIRTSIPAIMLWLLSEDSVLTLKTPN